MTPLAPIDGTVNALCHDARRSRPAPPIPAARTGVNHLLPWYKLGHPATLDRPCICASDQRSSCPYRFSLPRRTRCSRRRGRKPAATKEECRTPRRRPPLLRILLLRARERSGSGKNGWTSSASTTARFPPTSAEPSLARISARRLLRSDLRLTHSCVRARAANNCGADNRALAASSRRCCRGCRRCG